MVIPNVKSNRRSRLTDFVGGTILGTLAGYSIAASMTVETASFESLLSPVVVKCPDITPGSEISNATVKTVETDEGWKNIHVFYGDPKHIKKTDRLAQLKQDEIVAALTRHATGLYFVDLAAHEAMYISNTYRLERDWNWNGRECTDKTYYICCIAVILNTHTHFLSLY